MGILRVLLAISVVITHAPSQLQSVFVDGGAAVQGFFIISGFYMAMVLDRKYNFEGAVKLFYEQRYLRLAPMYWVSLLLTLTIGIAHAVFVHRPSPLLIDWSKYGASMSPFAIAGLVISQLSMFGIDLLMFCHLTGNPLHLALTHDWRSAPLPAVHFLLVPPAWSLSVELLFYAVAPWIVRRSSGLISAVILASFLLRWSLYHHFGFYLDPWDNRCFPLEIGVFLTGSLAYRLLPFADRLVRTRPIICIAGSLILLCEICLYGHLPLHGFCARYLFLASVAAMVPILFAATRDWHIDRWIGELSYPLYLLHGMAHYAIYSLLLRTGGVLHEVLLIGVPLAVAIAGQVLLESRFDAFRANILKRRMAARAQAIPARP
jgi:peptidoglycan/LPS O-acetylase OafA/YrhL